MTIRTIIASRVGALALAGALGFGAVSYVEASQAESHGKTVAFECNADSCNPSSCNWMWGSYPGTGSGC